MQLTPAQIQLIDLAIDEDLGRGDITTEVTVAPNREIRGRLIARQALVVSGTGVFEAVMKRVDPSLSVKILVKDGDSGDPDQVVIEVAGNAHGLLKAERVALNFMQRLSGIATLTRQFVDAIPGDAKALITDTRKTTPGMRSFERQAVRHGGGKNHRPDLGGGVLIKENHIAAAGAIDLAIQKARSGAPHPMKIEVEVTNRQELERAIDAGADIVLLDNMSLAELRSSVEFADGRVITEASGGVTLKTVADIARTGVDVISVGALTHSAPAADLSLLLDNV